jgi:hypothetical protein
MVELWAEEISGATQVAGIRSAWPHASLQAWDRFTRELGRAYRPSGRAPDTVRDSARRIATEMLAAGASHDDVRRALTRAVQEHPTRVLLEQQLTAQGRSHWEVLLADVLHCAADVQTTARRRHRDD